MYNIELLSPKGRKISAYRTKSVGTLRCILYAVGLSPASVQNPESVNREKSCGFCYVSSWPPLGRRQKVIVTISTIEGAIKLRRLVRKWFDIAPAETKRVYGEGYIQPRHSKARAK